MRNCEDWTQDTYARAEDAIGYTFRDRALLKACFTHSSYSNFRQGEKNNERLEFLGDAVLQLCVTEHLFEESGADEGTLTARRQSYVSRAALEEAEKRADLLRFLRHSGGEDSLAGKTASNLFEAVVGGIYLDGGYAAARAFLGRFLVETQLGNFKTQLQELLQERGEGIPVYRCTERDGQFFCTVSASEQTGSGRGRSKQAAEQAAAKQLYESLTKGTQG